MPNYHATANGRIPFTDEEEVQWAKMRLEWEEGVDKRAAEKVRSSRDKLLTECDWTQVIDAPVDQAAWAVYRQALRDIPAQEGFPNEVTWPKEPVAEEPAEEVAPE